MADLKQVADEIKRSNRQNERIGDLLEVLVDQGNQAASERFQTERDDVLSDKSDKTPMAKMAEGIKNNFEDLKTSGIEKIFDAFKTIAALGAISWLNSGGVEKVKTVISNIVDGFKKIANGDFATVASDLYDWIQSKNGAGNLSEITGLAIGAAGLTLATLFGSKTGIRLAAAGFALAAADSIGTWIENRTGSEAVGDVASMTVKGGALMSIIFGPKGAIVGAVAGFAISAADAIANWIEEQTGSADLGDFSKTLLRTLGGMGTGAIAGFMAYGPVGAVIGAIVGGVAGWLSGFISWLNSEDEETGKTNAQALKDDIKKIGKFFYDPETGKVLGVDWGKVLDEGLVLFEEAKTWVNTKLTDIGKFFYDAETGKVLGIDWGPVLAEGLVLFEEAKTWVNTKLTDIGKFFYDAETGKVFGVDWGAIIEDGKAIYNNAKTWVENKISDIGKFFYDAETGKVLGVDWGAIVDDAKVIFNDAKTWIGTKLSEVGKFFYDAETGKVLGIDLVKIVDDAKVIFNDVETWIKTKVSDIGKFFYDAETGKVLGIDWAQLAVDLHATHDQVETWIKTKVSDLGKFFYDAETGKVLGIDWGQLITDISAKVVETAKGIPEKIGNVFKELWTRIITTFTDLVNNIVDRVNWIIPDWMGDIPKLDLEAEPSPNEQVSRLASSESRAQRISGLITDYQNAGSREEQEKLIVAMQRFIDTADKERAAGIGAVVNNVTNNNTLGGKPLSVDIPTFD